MKGFTLRSLERKCSTSVAVDDINDQLRVLPVFILRFAHVKRAVSYIAHIFVPCPDGKLSLQKTICRTVVTASARLVKYQIVTMFLLEKLNQFQSCFSSNHFFNHDITSMKTGRFPAPNCRPRAARIMLLLEEAELLFAVTDQ